MLFLDQLFQQCLPPLSCQADKFSTVTMVMCFRNNDSLKLGRRDLFSGLRPISPGKSGRSWLQALHKIGQGFQKKKKKNFISSPKNTSEKHLGKPGDRKAFCPSANANMAKFVSRSQLMNSMTGL